MSVAKDLQEWMHYVDMKEFRGIQQGNNSALKCNIELLKKTLTIINHEILINIICPLL
jgi:hypothetical protein